LGQARIKKAQAFKTQLLFLFLIAMGPNAVVVFLFLFLMLFFENAPSQNFTKLFFEVGLGPWPYSFKVLKLLKVSKALTNRKLQTLKKYGSNLVPVWFQFASSLVPLWFRFGFS